MEEIPVKKGFAGARKHWNVCSNDQGSLATAKSLGAKPIWNGYTHLAFACSDCYSVRLGTFNY